MHRKITTIIGWTSLVLLAAYADNMIVQLTTTNGLTLTYSGDTTNPPPITLNYNPVILQTNSNNSLQFIVGNDSGPVTLMTADNTPLSIWAQLELSYDRTNWFTPDRTPDGYWQLDTNQALILVRARVCTTQQPSGVVVKD